MMSQHLRTPWTHKLITSPLGALMDTPYFEALKDRSLPKDFRLSRVGAAAASVGAGVESPEFAENAVAQPWRS